MRLGCDPGPAGSVRHRPQGRRGPLTRARPVTRRPATGQLRRPGAPQDGRALNPSSCRRPGPELPPSQDLSRPPRAVPEGRGRGATFRRPRERRAESCSCSPGSGNARGGGVGLGTGEDTRATFPNPGRGDPASPMQTTAPSRAALRPRSGQPPAVTPGSVRGVPRHPTPARGAQRQQTAGRRGDYFPPPSRAPPLVLARRNAPRCAGGGRIQRLLRDL